MTQRSGGLPRHVAVGLTLAIIGGALGGCSNMIDRPMTITGAQREAGLSYAGAVDYLNATRAKFQEQLDDVVKFDTGTKAGLGVGVTGAGISAVFRSAINPILGFLTLGGLSYGANQIIDPKTLGGIYLAGMGNLDCIDDGGAAARQTVAALKTRKEALAAALQVLKSDISSAEARRTGRIGVAIDEANKAFVQGELVLRSLDEYLKAVPIGEAMVSGVNATITAVNKQLLEKSPSLDAIAQSGSIFGSFINANAGLRGQIQTAVSAMRSPAAIGAVAGTDPTIALLEKDKAAVTAILAQIPAQLDPPNVAAIARCQTQFAADAAVAVQPPGPLELTAGGPPIRVTPTGKAPFQLLWVGPVPNDVDVNQGFNQITLAARTDATEHTNTFRIVDFSGKSSADVVVNVSPKSAATQKPLTTTPAQAETEDQLVKRMGLAKVAEAIGLNSADVVDRSDLRWANRVIFLEDCAKLSSTGKVSQALLDKLPATDCVQKAGTSQ